ncbi:MAG: D-glycero-beta-D-manno-heptose 1-phosphate adenylyltransferase [Pseudomonadota bacterium]
MNESLIRSIKPVSVLVAGDVMVDEYIIGEVERISPESPVPVVVVRDRLRRLGGAGNVAKNLVSMSAGVALFSAVGKDGAGRWFRRRCEEIGVESFWLKEDASRPTTIKTRVVARNQQIVRVDEEHVGPLSREMEKAVKEDLMSVVPQIKSLVISDYGKGFLGLDLTKAIINAGRDNGVPVFIDPKGLDYSRYKGTTYITPNVREASLASGVDIQNTQSLVRAGRVILEQTEAEGVVITRGREGITLVTRDDYRDFPVKPVEIIDVTGAGDTVIAALALCVGGGMEMENAIEIANLAASIVVSRFGAASVTLDEMVSGLNNRSLASKVVTRKDIARIVRQHRMRGEKIVFTNGCFDLFHTGHLKTLRESSDLGDVLIVGINSDKSVQKLKGAGRPVVPEAERVEIVSSITYADYVVVFDEDTPKKLIQDVRPDVLVKGEDWEGRKVVGEDVVKARGGRVVFVKHAAGVSTTDLINRIRGESGP